MTSKYLSTQLVSGKFPVQYLKAKMMLSVIRSSLTSRHLAVTLLEGP